MTSSADFEGSGSSFARQLGGIRSDQWDRSVRQESAPRPSVLDHAGLDSWTVRQLAGHAVRAILTVETYLAHDEPATVDIRTAEEYYRTVYPALSDERAIVADGVTAGRWLGDEPGTTVADCVSRTTALIESQPYGRAVSIGGIGIPLDQYLRTRVVELVLHCLDLQAATGVPASLPAAAVSDAATLVSAVLPDLRHGEERLLVLVAAASAA